MKKSVEEKLEEALNIESEIIEATEVIHPMRVIGQQSSDSTTDEDFDKARANITRLIAAGEEAVEGILRLASESEQPRAYEVASTLIKTMVEANKDLIDIHKKKKEIDKEEYDGPKTQVQNNTLFVGSTKELQKHLLQLAKGGARTTDE
jgi:hypothetical protein